jgi:hypothetical protein
MTFEKKINTIKIQRIKNGYLMSSSPFSDGSGADLEAFKTAEKLAMAVWEALDKESTE